MSLTPKAAAAWQETDGEVAKCFAVETRGVQLRGVKAGHYHWVTWDELMRSLDVLEAQAAQIAVLTKASEEGTVGFLNIQIRELREQRAALNAQVTRLQEANNKEVERRREAERARDYSGNVAARCTDTLTRLSEDGDVLCAKIAALEAQLKREVEQRVGVPREGLAVFGSDSCRTCSSGRITLYVRPPYICTGCSILKGGENG